MSNAGAGPAVPVPELSVCPPDWNATTDSTGTTRRSADEYDTNLSRRSQHCTDFSSSTAAAAMTNDGSTVYQCPGTSPCTNPCYPVLQMCTTTACVLGEDCRFQSSGGATPNADGDLEASGWKVECSSCPAGMFGGGTPGGTAEACSACPVGKYTKEADRDGPQKVATVAQCYDCEPGSFADRSPHPRWDECWGCQPGEYQPTGGSTECLKCEKGKYMPGNNALACLACEDGKYQPNTGESSCLTCDGTVDADKTTCTPKPPTLLGGLFGLEGQECRVGECPGYLQRINQCLCTTCCPEVQNHCQTRFARMTADCC